MAAEPREALKDKIRELAHLSPEEWDERRGADPIARTINAVFDIIDSEPTLDVARRASDAQVAGLREALRSVGWNERDGLCWCRETPDIGLDKPLKDHEPRCLEARVALAAAPAPQPATPLDEHRMGPPHWEPGDPQDGWTNRCLKCDARWTVNGCPNARRAEPEGEHRGR